MASASTARCMARLPLRTARNISSPAPIRSIASHQTRLRQPIHQSYRRAYSSEPPPKPSHLGRYVTLGGLTVAGGVGYYIYSTNNEGAIKNVLPSSSEASANKQQATPAADFKPSQQDYQAVYNEIASRLEEKDDYDDGSFGPVIVRLAWHCSGTYDKATNTGGSNGATMRFDPESDHGANAGLRAARDFMEPVKKKFPWISYSDLWTLGGVAAIQEMQGPIIQWRPGRQDKTMSFCTPDGRLPDANKGEDHIRAIFTRMGFNDQEMVALSGAHALGRCHTDRSGFDGPWTFSPTVMTNDYYKSLMDEKWQFRDWNGPKQYQDKSKALMMLPTDMALVKDTEFKKHVERYAKDDGVFFQEFSDVITKLLELGVSFTSESRMSFKPSHAE